jgi:polyhydroxybutyrate depolymerase
MKATRLLLTFCTILLFTGCTRFQNRPTLPASIKAGQSEGSLVVDGVNRHYLLYVPASYSGSAPVALILNFHGMGATSLDEEGLSGMSGKAEKEGFIVVYPDGIDKAWNDGSGPESIDDLNFVITLVTTLEGQYSIDPKRIYATGI